MKRLTLLLLLIVCACSLGACMFMGAEDREFYGKGWLSPKELDRQPVANLPARPAANDNAQTNTLPSKPSSSDWATPAPF